MAPREERSRSFAALADRRFRLLWLGATANSLAIFSQMIARGWLAKELTGSNAGLGGVVWAYGLSALITTPLGGVVADRVPRRALLLVSTAVMVLASVGVAVAVYADVVAYWMLLAASAVMAVGFAGMVPARMAFTAELVGRELMPNAIVLSQISMNASQIVGPALAGVLISSDALGVGSVYLVGTVLGCVSLGLFALLPPGHLDPNRVRRSPRAEMADGVRYARRNREVGSLLVVSLLITMIGFPYMTFLPTVADGFFGRGASGYSQLSVTAAVGGLAASMFIAGRASGGRAARYQQTAAIVFGIALIGVSASPTFWAALAGILFVGAGHAMFQSMNATMVMSRTEPAYHGRVQSLLSMGWAGFGLAALPLGWIADQVGLRPTLTVMGACALAAILGYRVFGEQPTAAAASAAGGLAPTVATRAVDPTAAS